jgi:2-amino-4-hydroxy-6-hydroxymethyldihydropteridine diphosphokinase/dihydropteroate synthase
MIFAIGIGSNLGNRFLNIERAKNYIISYGIKILKQSIIYQNKAWIPENIDNKSDYDIDFFNCAILCDSKNFSPNKTLYILKEIERKMGRIENFHWYPRVIDLDLLFFDDLIVKSQDFVLPHYAIFDRPFVLLPLLQIIPQWIHPIYKKSISQICQEKQFSSTNNDFISILSNSIKIMGIVNLTSDSFSGDGYLNGEIQKNEIVEEIWKKFLDGASVLDFGAQSTRPNSEIISFEEEIKRMKNIMDDFFQIKFNMSKIFPEISIDSFYPEVIEYCIKNYKVDIINDVSGISDQRLLDFLVNSDRKIVLMHNLEIPAGKRNLYDSCDVVLELSEWFEKKIEKILNYKGGLIRKEQIILDPGIGFGKTISQSYDLIKKIKELKKFGLEILFGHSRKSFMKNISSSQNRENETLAISLKIAKDVNYLRIHDVKTHCNAIATSNYIDE